jgi:hypothetical protein
VRRGDGGQPDYGRERERAAGEGARACGGRERDASHGGDGEPILDG